MLLIFTPLIRYSNGSAQGRLTAPATMAQALYKVRVSPSVLATEYQKKQPFATTEGVAK